MKIGDYITAESWNSLSSREQGIFLNGLIFLGNDLDEVWLPKHRINNAFVILIESPFYLLEYYTVDLEEEDTEFSIEEIRAFIKLMSFEDDHEKV